MGLGTAEELGKVIAGGINASEEIKQDAIPAEIINSMLLAPIDQSKVTTTVNVYKRVISNVLTVGHSTLGAVYVYPVYVPIVLGHSQWGVLGKGYLPAPTSNLTFTMTFPLEFDEVYTEYERTLLHTYTS